VSEENKALIQRFVEEAFNEDNLDVTDEVYAADVLSHESTGPVEQFLGTYRSAFADGRTTVDRISGGKIEEGWNNFDQLGMLKQLGVAPAAGQ